MIDPEKPSRETQSFWMQATPSPQESQGVEDHTADVCVVGAGIAGLTTAHLLSQEGLNVTVLEAQKVGYGQTLRTTAHASNVLDEGFVQLERVHGPQGAQLAARSHKEAMNRIAQLADEIGSDCDLRWLTGYLFSGRKVRTEKLQEEYQASQRAGLLDCALLPRAPWDFFDTGPCISYPQQLTFDPGLLMASLHNHVIHAGVKVFSNSRVTKMQGGQRATLHTEDGAQVRARHIVLATNSPIYGKVVLHTKQAAYRTYVVGAKIPKGSLPDALYWDMETPYHYVRIAHLSESHDLLIVGGEDHKTGELAESASPFAELEKWTLDRFPMVEGIAHRWSGQVMEPVDGLGLLGRHKDANTYVITGDSGHGFTHGVLGAMIVSDLIMGRSSPWQDLYDPARFQFKSSGSFLKENVKVIGHYGEWLRRERPEVAESLLPGEGVVLQKGFKKIAVSKDHNSVVHTRSAACTHMGCVVRWNPIETTWDCPCHGSRFSQSGEVLQGPATRRLS